MRHISNEIKVEDFVKSRLKDRRAMLRASKLIDEFRKAYGKVRKGFDSVEIIRKMRDSRR
jgi:hypothetical protein